MFLLNRVLYNESTSCENIFFSQMNAQMIIRTFSSGNPLARAERTGDGVDAAQSSLFLKLCTKERT